jgi:creatinine amidohydrolase
MLTWVEIEQAIKRGVRTAVIVIGASEQHGPHLPEGTDTLLGEAVACALATEIEALVAPPIPIGCSDHHMEFAGTLSIAADTLMQLLDGYVASLRRHGFDRFVVFSSHGGNTPVLAEWRRRQPCDVTVIADLVGYGHAMLQAVRPFGRNDTGGPHADVTETAAMLSLYPHLVRRELGAAGWVGPIDVADLPESGLRRLTANGVLGDPCGATAEMGDAVLQALVRFLMSRLACQP